jgi:cobalt-zinc-cadmium efflux system outer membrane protein
MRLAAARVFLLASALALATPALASDDVPVSLDEALRAARLASPDLAVARAREAVAHAEVAVAGVYPNPSVSAASSTEAARISGTVSVPLVVLGQRGAAMDAARADEATVLLDTRVSWNDARRATQRAYADLWEAEGVADARREAASIESALEASVVQRVEVGSAPQLDALRVHAEKLRADADVLEATAQVTAAASELGRWMGVGNGSALRAKAVPVVPETVPPLDALRARLETSALVRREQSDLRAAEARADRERALVRPAMMLDLGFDALDRTLNNATSYRAQLSVEVPILQQRGAYIDRERALGEVARARVRAALALGAAELTAAYRTFEAATARQRTLTEAVEPASRAAAKATEEAYGLGRAPLIAVLDAERVLVETRVSGLQAQAARARAWAEVQHALGGPE